MEKNNFLFTILKLAKRVTNAINIFKAYNWLFIEGFVILLMYKIPLTMKMIVLIHEVIF